MRAKIVGITLVVTPETDEEREQLRNKNTGLWECYGWDENSGSFLVQPLCPVGLQDTEIMDHIRFMLECDAH